MKREQRIVVKTWQVARASSNKERESGPSSWPLFKVHAGTRVEAIAVAAKALARRW